MTCTHTHIDGTCINICDGGHKTYLRTMRRCPCCNRLRPLAGVHQDWYGTPHGEALDQMPVYHGATIALRA